MITATFESLPSLAGTEIGVSDWITVDQARIDKFADATNDRQWIHVDVEMAKKFMPGGKTIAHGFLTLALIPGLTENLIRLEGMTRIINYGANRVRFISMVPEGSRLRARQKLVSVEPKSGGLQVINEVTVEMEGSEKPACVAELVTLVFK